MRSILTIVALTGFCVVVLALLVASGCTGADGVFSDASRTRPPETQGGDDIDSDGLEDDLPVDGQVFAVRSVCDDCVKATAGGCDLKGGPCTKPECGTTSTKRADGGTECIQDCADKSVFRVTCL